MLNCPCTLALKTWLTWLRCYRRGYEWHFQDMQYKEDPNELPYPVFYLLTDSDLLCGSVKWFTRVLVTVRLSNLLTHRSAEWKLARFWTSSSGGCWNHSYGGKKGLPGHFSPINHCHVSAAAFVSKWGSMSWIDKKYLANVNACSCN